MYFKGKVPKLDKKLGAFSLLLFGLGNVLGPQIFLMLGGLVALSGPYALISLILCAIICFLVAANYLELGLSMPITSLVVSSTHDAYGGFVSFISGWCQLFGNVAFAAVCALGFGTFIGKPIVGGILIIMLFTVIELRGIEVVAKIKNIFVIVLLAFLLIIIITNTPSSYSFNFVFDLSGIQKIMLGVGFFFLAFTNFEDLVTYSEEVKDIRKLPLAMFSTITIISLFFIGIYFVIINNNINLADPLLSLSKGLFGNSSAYIISAMAIFAALSSLLGALSSSSRNVYSMGEKGFLPKILYYSKNGDLPAYATILASVIAGVIALLMDLRIIIYIANFTYFLLTIIVSMTVIKLREHRSLLERPFKIPFFPVPVYLTILLMITLMFFLDPRSIILGIIWLFLGFLVYNYKAIGPERLKAALIGGNIIAAIFIVLSAFAFRAMIPELFETLKFVIILVIVCLGALSIILYKDSISQ